MRKRLRIGLAVGVWAAGTWAVWAAVPVMPRGEWPFPFDRRILAYPPGGRFVVTGHAEGNTRWTHGVVEVWDLDTGRVVNRYLRSEDRFHCQPTDGYRRLFLTQTHPTGADPLAVTLRLIDPLTGEEIWHLTNREPTGAYTRSQASPDGMTVAVATTDKGGQPRMDLHDVTAGRHVRSLPGCEPRVFTAGSDRLVAHRPVDAGGPATVVWDVASGEPVGTIPKALLVVGVTRDGRTILDFRGEVWDVPTGAVRFRLGGIQDNCRRLSADDRWLIAEHRTDAGSWLSWYDLETGVEDVGRRVFLEPRNRSGMFITYQDRDRGLIRSDGTWHRTPSKMDQWLRRNLRWLGFRIEGTDAGDRTFLVDEAAGRVVAQIDGQSHGLTADGSLLLTSTRDHRTAIWDIPPRKPFWRVAGLSLGWGAVIGLVARLWRRRHTPHATPLIASSESRA